MTNNDVLRRIRYIFDFDDTKMLGLFNHSEGDVSREDICAWLKKDDVDGFAACSDHQLAVFLNGLIRERRGEKEGVKPVAERQLTNNIIFRKLKIALDYKDVDILALMRLADFTMSKHELSALFRKAGHKNYRVCNDQILRKFLTGVQIKFRDEKPDGKQTFQW